MNEVSTEMGTAMNEPVTSPAMGSSATDTAASMMDSGSMTSDQTVSAENSVVTGSVMGNLDTSLPQTSEPMMTPNTVSPSPERGAEEPVSSTPMDTTSVPSNGAI
jgi:hypothetical protein